MTVSNPQNRKYLILLETQPEIANIMLENRPYAEVSMYKLVLESLVFMQVGGELVQETALYKTRVAQTQADIQCAQALRADLFCLNADEVALDQDQFDHTYHHVLIESVETGELLATFRFIYLANGKERPQHNSSFGDFGKFGHCFHW